LRGIFDLDKASARIAELKTEVESPTLWNDAKKAREIMREHNYLNNAVSGYRALEQGMSDNIELIAMAESENDEVTIIDAEKSLTEIAVRAKKLEMEGLLSGEADSNDCFLEIHSGAGGTESQDWASMLLRMYLRWAEKRGFKVELVEESPGEEAGIKSATLKITGQFAYGWAKTESGVHRLVRISPFNSQGKRMTSFASCWVFPIVDDNIEIEILDKDLRIDTYRASGAGGQHINKTDSAIRITHIPTGIVVQCQTSRSQHRNRAEAFAMLRSRMYERELSIREAAANAINSQKTDNSWGNQIRSYVLQPYQMVKDLRTGYETSNTASVLDGDLDGFMAAALAERIAGKGG